MGVEDDQQHGHGGAHLYPGVCQPADSEDGARDGQPGQGDLLAGDGCTTGLEEDRGGGRTNFSHSDKLVESDTYPKDTFGSTFSDERHHHSRTYGGEDWRCARAGTGRRRDSDMLLRNGGQAPLESEGREELREDVLPVPTTSAKTMPMLQVDNVPALPRRGELQVQARTATGLDLCGCYAQCGARTLPAQGHYEGGRQRLCQPRELCGLQEGAQGREEEPSGQGAKGQQNAPDPDSEEYQKFREWQRQQK